MKYAVAFAMLALAACDPRAVADKAVARTAESVISPVVGVAATRCIVDNASPEELLAIAKDIGVEAGSSTVANIMEIAKRPATLVCLGTAGASLLQRG